MADEKGMGMRAMVNGPRRRLRSRVSGRAGWCRSIGRRAWRLVMSCVVEYGASSSLPWRGIARTGATFGPFRDACLKVLTPRPTLATLLPSTHHRPWLHVPRSPISCDNFPCARFLDC
jgi:hypothetical protein